MKKDLIICDTNIFIHLLNHNQLTITKLQELGLGNILLSSITVMELLQGMNNKLELQKMQKVLKQYNILHFNS
jgi:predicted nucleic acid-binding protein